jgi:hypothetical protein
MAREMQLFPASIRSDESQRVVHPVLHGFSLSILICHENLKKGAIQIEGRKK